MVKLLFRRMWRSVDIIEKITEAMRGKLVHEWGYLPFSQLDPGQIDNESFDLDARTLRHSEAVELVVVAWELLLREADC